MPKVSVIIPVYNVENYLKQCLDSVVNQTLKDIEIICIDDGSTDNSVNILKEYAAKDDRIKVIHQENKGLGGARNTGIKNAHAPYLFFIDSDDWILVDCLEKLYNKITLVDADICIYGLKKYEEQSKEYIIDDYFGLSLYGDCINKLCTYKDIKSSIFERFGAVLKFYNREFFIKNDLFYEEGVYFEDVVPHVKSIILASTIVFLDERLYIYRCDRTDSIMSSSKNSEKVFDVFKFFVSVYNFLNKLEVLPEIEKEFCIFVLNQAYYHSNRILNKKIQKSFINEFIFWGQKIKLQDKLNKYPELKNRYKQIIKITKKDNFILSIRNEGIHKVVSILGIKLKIKSKKLVEKKRYNDLDKKIKKLSKELKAVKELINAQQ